MSLTKIRLREAWNWGGLSARELARRTWQEMDKHGTLDRAAVVAYYAMLALVPLIGLVLAIAMGWSDRIRDQLPDLLPGLPAEARRLLVDQVDMVAHEPHTGVLSVGFLILLWSASSLFVAVMDATNASYGVRDNRPWWKRRLWAIVLTVVESVLLLAAALSIILWPRVMGWLGLGTFAATLATVVQWLVVLVALFASFAIAYFFGPDVEQEWEWITPGSTLGVLALVVGTLAMRFYLLYGANYSATYGALTGVIVTLLWLYLAALALLLGAEINTVIEHAAPHGKEKGQKTEPQARAAG
jgi:membrane protein